MGIRLGIKGKVRRNRLLFRMILIEEARKKEKASIEEEEMYDLFITFIYVR